MTKQALAGAVAVAIAALSAVACEQAQASSSNNEALVKRGEYLVTVGGCNDCHTPLKMGRERAGARHVAHAVRAPRAGDGDQRAGTPDRRPGSMASPAPTRRTAGPWGVSFTANLTPDKNTGIGIWTEEHVHQGDPHRPALGHVAPDPAADALVQLRQDDRRGSEGDLRLPAHASRRSHNHVPEPLPPAAVPTATAH